MLRYKGYTGHVIYDDEAKILHGEVSTLKDVITFQGKTVDEIEQAFIDSIEDYLEWCKELNVEPEKPFSGNIHLRLTPDLHAKLVSEAKYAGISLNNFIDKAIRKSISL